MKRLTPVATDHYCMVQTSRNRRPGKHLSRAKNFVSLRGRGGASTMTSSSLKVISSGFRNEFWAGGCMFLWHSSSSIKISSGFWVKILWGRPWWTTRASYRVWRWAANHHSGFKALSRPISGGDPRVPELISWRRKLLRLRRLERSPYCSIDCGQSWDKNMLIDDSCTEGF